MSDKSGFDDLSSMTDAAIKLLNTGHVSFKDQQEIEEEIRRERNKEYFEKDEE